MRNRNSTLTARGRAVVLPGALAVASLLAACTNDPAPPNVTPAADMQAEAGSAGSGGANTAASGSSGSSGSAGLPRTTSPDGAGGSAGGLGGSDQGTAGSSQGEGGSEQGSSGAGQGTAGATAAGSAGTGGSAAGAAGSSAGSAGAAGVANACGAAAKTGYALGDVLGPLPVRDCATGEITTLEEVCNASATWVFAAHTHCPTCKATAGFTDDVAKAVADQNVVIVHTVYDDNGTSCETWKKTYGLASYANVRVFADPGGAVFDKVKSASFTAPSLFLRADRTISHKEHGMSKAAVLAQIATALAP